VGEREGEGVLKGRVALFLSRTLKTGRRRHERKRPTIEWGQCRQKRYIFDAVGGGEEMGKSPEDSSQRRKKRGGVEE